MVSGDYQIAVLLISSSGTTITAGPTGWTALSPAGGEVVTSTSSPDQGGTMRIAIFENTTGTSGFSVTTSATVQWVVLRAAYILPAGSSGRTQPLYKTLETGTGVTSHPLPAVTTTAVDSLIIASGLADMPSAVTWTSVGTLTQRVHQVGGTANPQVASVLADKQQATTISATSPGTFTSSVADTTGLYCVVLNGVVSEAPPTVGAGADDTSHFHGTEFTRTATEDDGGGTISARSWTLTSAPAGVTTGVVDSDITLNYTPALGALGNYTFEYSATNEFGTDTDSMVLTVDAGAPGSVVGVPILGIDKLAVRLTGATGTVRMAVSTVVGMTSPVYGSAVTPEAQGDAHLPLPTGLTPGTTYYYQVESALTLIGTVRSFVNMPTGSTFKIGFGSCRSHDANEPSPDPTAFSRIKTRGANLFWMTGDIHYRDYSTNSPTNFRTGYDEIATRTNFSTLFATVPSDYVWSDHDYGGDASHSGTASKPAAQSVYRERFPSVTLPSGTGGIYHTYKIWDNRVRVIVLDTRSYRSTVGATDNSSKTMLGTEQKAWLEALLETPDTLLTFIISAEGWIGNTSGINVGQDHWGFYNTERVEIAGWISSTTTQCIFICGDAHMLAYDNGSNSPGGAPVWHAAALNRFASEKGGPYSGGVLTGQNQYGFITLTEITNGISAQYQGFNSSDAQWGTHTVSVITYNELDSSQSFTLTEQSQVTVLHSRSDDLLTLDTETTLVAPQVATEALTVTESAAGAVDHDRIDDEYTVTEEAVTVQLQAQASSDTLDLDPEISLRTITEIRASTQLFTVTELSDRIMHETSEMVDDATLLEEAFVEVAFDRVDDFLITTENRSIINPFFSNDDLFILTEHVDSIVATLSAGETFGTLLELLDTGSVDLPNYIYGYISTILAHYGISETTNHLQGVTSELQLMRGDTTVLEIAAEISQ